MLARQGQEDRDGRRVLVIWVCWLALALFLAAAGVIVW